MSLPIVVIFDRHWDTIPKSVIKDLLPDLTKKGYETLCLEAPQNLSSLEMIDRIHSGLEHASDIQQTSEKFLKRVGIITQLSDMSFGNLAELLKLYVSSKKYVSIAEKIKHLPAGRVLNEMVGEAAKLSMSLKGIDVDSEYFDEAGSADLSNRMSCVERIEDFRITSMVHNLLKIRAQQDEGIIFTVGARHAKGLMDEFKKLGLQDEVLYYFPHSSSRYDESVDDIEVAMTDTSGALLSHTHLLAPKDIKPFGERIVRDITGKTRYTRELRDYNSHLHFLSAYFKTNFKAFLRPGYHVDALVDVTEPPDIEDIQRRISATGVQIHQIFMDGRNYLAIPNVNSRDIAERIRKIPSK